MDRILPTLGILVIVIGCFALVLRAWRRRVHRDASLGGGYPRPVSEPMTEAVVCEAWYVATTRAGEPLERVALPGLSYRGRARLTIDTRWLALEVRGEDPVFVPATALSDFGPATATIDRVVERDGLIRFGWETSNGFDVDSYLRITDPQTREACVRALGNLIPLGDPHSYSSLTSHEQEA